MKFDENEWVENRTGLIVNVSGVPEDQVMSAMMHQAPELASLVRWTQNTQRTSRAGGLVDRDRYLTPGSIFAQFATALDAVESDDVVSAVLESTESLAFQAMGFVAEDEDEENVWNQIGADLDLDSRLREMWRELFTVSQFYCASFFKRKTYRVKGKTSKGVTRKKEFKDLLVPAGLTLIDPKKVLPVGNFMFNQERLVYIADRGEAVQFDNVLAGGNTSDLIVQQFIQEKYVPDVSTRMSLAQMTDANVDNLYYLNPDFVWRHTASRPQYQRFATVRLKSIFELLDLKQNLRELDRTFILGGTSFILLVKKGTDALPAKPAELAALAANVRQVSKVPIIVGDHRLSVEIITPKQDHVLVGDKYDTLDERISARLYQTFMTRKSGSNDDSQKLARVVASGMESRRHMLRRALEKNVFRPTFDRNDSLTSLPKLNFYPKRIALNFDPTVATFLQDLRDRGDISRETILYEAGLHQSDEAMLREREKAEYDKIFSPTNVPFNSPNAGGDKPVTNPASQKSAGRRGGGRSGGGGSNRNSNVPNDTPVNADLEFDDAD
jgi:hypothetical protein